MLPLLLLASFFINMSFYSFFESYLTAQEKEQIRATGDSLYTYIEDKSTQYIGNVSDWGHWKDTYRFVDSGGEFFLNAAYVAANITPSTFQNRDISFAVFVNADNTVVRRYYYNSVSEAFSEFPRDFSDGLDGLLFALADKQDTFDICRLGDRYYFVASTGITDDNLVQKTNGRLIIGRIIDGDKLSGMEKILNCSFVSMESMEENPIRQESGPVELHDLDRVEAEDKLMFSFVYHNDSGAGPPVHFAFSKPREYYVNGKKQVMSFAQMSALILAGIFLGIFLLLGLFLSRPLMALIRDVKGIDQKSEASKKLKVSGNDEFTFLRKSINSMLQKIEAEQTTIRNREEQLYATLVSVGDGVIAVDRESRIQLLNPVAQNLTGWKQSEAENEPIERVFRIIHEYTREPVESPVKKVFETGGIIELANHTMLLGKDGREIPIEDTAAPIKDKDGQIMGCVLVFRDFSERKEKQKRIEYLSYHDQLTGLYNRRFFEEELRRIDTAENLPIAFVYADVNGLKTINDAFGHVKGDQLIEQVAETLRMESRSGDIASRTGGDEFIMVFPKTDAAAAEKLVGRIKGKIEEKTIMDIHISVSFGWDIKNTERQNSMDVLKNAENYMYKKKISNRASVRSAVIQSILNTLRLKVPRLNGHSTRVGLLCERLGAALGLEGDALRELKAAGELHDIGKIAVDEQVLNKIGSLSDAEWAQIKAHPETGYRILGTSNEYYNIAEYVLAHHEHWDGTGYPKGLKGSGISRNARLIAVADAYDAMTSPRPYKRSLSREEAIAELQKNTGTQFDPDIVRVFIQQVLSVE